ncbi:MAG: DUF2752 domain-containing protein [Ferruginibacter sp.]
MINRHLNRIIILLLFIGAVFVYYMYDPTTSGYFPDCPFYKLTGLFCPGCGAQRSIHYLLTGNIAAAMRSNILLVIFLPFLMGYYIVQTFNYYRPQQNINIGIVHKTWFIYSIAIVFVFYWAARNIGFLGAGFLAPH